MLVFLIGMALGVHPFCLHAAAVYALLLVNAYFGRMVNYEAPTNFFALAVVWVLVADSTISGVRRIPLLMKCRL